ARKRVPFAFCGSSVQLPPSCFCSGTARYTRRLSEVGGKNPSTGRASGTGSEEGMSKGRPSSKIPRAWTSSKVPLRNASAFSSYPAKPNGLNQSESAANWIASSKYRLCAWKWCGPRYMPSAHTILERCLTEEGLFPILYIIVVIGAGSVSDPVRSHHFSIEQ